MKPFQRGAKTAPSQYPRVVFHGLRSLQLLASLIVGGIMSYFMYELHHDKWRIPWTFMLLMAASLFSIVALTVTIVMHCCFGLNPRFNLAVNGFQTILWAVSWSLLTWYMSGTLAHVCDIEHWKEDLGIMVCRIYKALFTFTLIGFVSTVAALGVDIYVHRKQTQRGMYRLPDTDSKGVEMRNPIAEGHESERRESGVWDASQLSTGHYGENADPKAQQEGYAVPENQFDYDTGYRGPGRA